MYGLVAALPYQRHVAGVSRRQPPGKKGRNAIAAHYQGTLCQLTHHR